jgi:F0F1-type ATP synthase membrane subunit c/vacuolar-type H+-ATPase subunit K
VVTTTTEAGSEPEVATALPPRRSDRLTAVGAWIVVGIAAVAAGVLLLHLGRGTTWFYDEWSWVLQRRTGSVDDFLANHNGHLNLLPVIAYKASWAFFGLDNYTPLRVLAIVLHIATCVLLFTYARRRSPIWLAVALTVMVLFVGRAWGDLLWPFQITYVGSVAAGLGALLLLDRRDRLGDISASVALGAAVACSGVGLPFIGAVALELVWRRSTWRRLWIPLAPLALYGVWYLEYGAAQAKASNIHLVPGYTERSGAASTGALFGQAMDHGHLLLAILVVAVIVVVGVRRKLSPRLVAVLALPLFYWVLTALSRAELNEPDASRYLYAGAIFVALIIVELAHLVPLPRGRVVLALLVGAVVVITVVSVRGNEQPLRLGAAGLRDASTYVKAELAALELAGNGVEPGFQPDPIRAPQITAGPYADAVADLGSPADSIASVRGQSEAVRSAADGVLVRALRLGLLPVTTATSAGAPPTPVVRQGSSALEGQCILVTPQDGRGTIDLRGDALALNVQADASAGVDVAVRNLASGFEGAPLGTIPANEVRAITLPRVRSGPWTTELSSTGAFRVC